MSLHLQIDRVTKNYLEAIAHGKFDESRIEDLEDRLQALVAQLSKAPDENCSLADVTSWARCALVWADRDAQRRAPVMILLVILRGNG